MSAPFDVVVFGATGASGRQLARYLAQHVQGERPLRLAIAGRNTPRLEMLARSLPASVEIIRADAAAPNTIDAMVAQARVVVSTAGPYALHGEAVVDACARRGVDYLDLCGETAHIRRMIDRYHQLATASGARIVPACGFDSVPSDLGVWLLVEHFRRRGAQTATVRALFRATGGYNDGTRASTVQLWKRPQDVQAMRDPFLLDPPAGRHRRRAGNVMAHADPVVPRFDPDVSRWVAPFFMGPINTRIVRRSAALADEHGEGYGERFAYQEYWDPGGPFSWAVAGAAAWGMGFFHAMSSLPIAPMVADLLPPGGSPQVTSLVDDHFRALFIGNGSDGSRAWVRLTGRGDPANRVTTHLAGEATLALALDRARLPGGATRSGILTPATAFGGVLAERLRAAGIGLECRELEYGERLDQH